MRRVEAMLRRAGGALLERVEVESDYRGPELPAGTRSVAFRLDVPGRRTARCATREVDAGRDAAPGRARGRAGRAAARCRRDPRRRVTWRTPTIVPTCKALAELEQLLRHLTEELGALAPAHAQRPKPSCARREASGGVVAGPELKEARQRVIELESREPGAAAADRGGQGAAPGARGPALVPRAARRRERRHDRTRRTRCRSPSAARSTPSARSSRRSTPARWRPTSTRRSSGCATRCRWSRPTRPRSSPRWRSPTSCSRPAAATARSRTASSGLADELARLLPPAKRGKRAAAS